MRWCAMLLAVAALSAAAWQAARAEPRLQQRFDGLNVIATPEHPFGTASATLSLANAKLLGARAVAVVPFLWQATPADPHLVRGDDINDAQLHAAIVDAHALGLAVIVKPHVWVPQSWAGAVAMTSEEEWHEWFANYRRELQRIAQIAKAENAEALAIGTELAATSQRPEWQELIASVRAVYPG